MRTDDANNDPARRGRLHRMGVGVGAAVTAALMVGLMPGAAQASPRPGSGAGDAISPCTACRYVKPDLTVSTLDPDNNRAAIKNVGSIDAAGSWAYVRNNFQGAGGVVFIPPLRAGQEHTFTFPRTISPDHCSYVVADYYNQINEITDGNNVGKVHDAYCG